jgi:glycolate oxidase FAD binding subunit
VAEDANVVTQLGAGAAGAAVVTPRDEAECVQAFRDARLRRHAVACVGGGTELGLGPLPTRVDVVVRTTRLARVKDYTPEDQVIDVEGGLTLGELQRTLGARGQRLAYDPPGAAGATLGGLVATSAFGPLRTRYGSLRDLIIGVTLLRADGVVAHGGGKVVKTVAGFDLPKLAVGSLGTLGMVLGATFRVHPLPEASATVFATGLEAAAVRELVVRLRDAQLEPAATAALGDAGRYALGVRFEGFAAGVAQQRARFVEHAAARSAGCEWLDDATAARFWSDHDAARLAGDARVKLSGLPAALAAALPVVVRGFEGALTSARVSWYPSLGLAFVTGELHEAAPFAAAVTAARAALAKDRGFVVVERAPASALTLLGDPWGPRSGAHALMHLVKSRFDPEGRMNPGRFLGSIG